MKKKSFLLTFLFLTIITFSGCMGRGDWGYVDKSGPEYWGNLSEKFKHCSEGKNQSPVNLTDFVEASLRSVRFHYKSSLPDATEIINDGNVITVNYTAGSYIKVDNNRFELKKFQFHAPSEHTINGVSFPMEGQFIHEDDSGNQAVVVVLYKKGRTNHTIKRLWDQLPEQADDSAFLRMRINALGLMPLSKRYYRYNGSLTTPPCTEGIIWLVMKNSISISESQIRRFEKFIYANNRPVQPLNARKVLK